MDFEKSETYKNLLKTFAGESRARNKYTFYGEKAKSEGYQYIASIFEQTADNEKAHAREVFNRFLKMNNTILENLRDSAEGEALESTKLYKEFEQTAREEGYEDIANFYKEIREVEESHRNRFTIIGDELEAGMEFKREKPVKWQCMNCGYIHIGEEASKVCPLCKYPRGYFKIYCEDYK